MHKHENEKPKSVTEEAPMVSVMRQLSKDYDRGWTEEQIAEYAERFWNGILISMRIEARIMREEDERRKANRKKLEENGDI